MNWANKYSQKLTKINNLEKFERVFKRRSILKSVNENTIYQITSGMKSVQKRNNQIGDGPYTFV